MTFVEAVKDGVATLDDIHEWIDAWHESPTDDGLLHTYLGLTWEQSGRWVQSPKTLGESVEEQLKEQAAR